MEGGRNRISSAQPWGALGEWSREVLGGPTREATGPCLGASLGSSGHPWEPPAPQDPHGGLQLLPGGLPGVRASSQTRRGGGQASGEAKHTGCVCGAGSN